MHNITVGRWIKYSEGALVSSGQATARLDALVLLEDATSKDRTHLLAHPELELTEEQEMKLRVWIDRRKKHEPLAYIREKSEFYGREFYVNHTVLVPRPETEVMIELLKKLPLPPHSRIADVGSGSGAIGITAALELPKSQVDLFELDTNALKVSHVNTKAFNTHVQCLQSNLLEEADETKYDAILANLPYVPEDYQINEAAEHEPSMALFGGFDGLDLYRTMFGQLREHTSENAFVLTEALTFQHVKLASIAKARGFELYQTEGLIQVFQKA